MSTAPKQPPQQQPQQLVSIGDFQTQLTQIQSEYETRITELKQHVTLDADAVDLAAAETQTKLAELVRTFQSQLEGTPKNVVQLFAIETEAEPGPKALYDNSLCALNLDLAVYDGDRDSLALLLGDPQFVFAADDLLKENPVFRGQRDLLQRSLHLPQSLAPKLHDVGDRCREALGLIPALEFHLLNESLPFVSCYMPATDRIDVIVSTGTLERFTEGELAFTIGHQLGHTLYDHHRLPINLMLERAGTMLFPAHALRIFAWKRKAEITADRVGLLCCDDLEIATSALFKLSTGTQAETMGIRLDEYREKLAAGEHPEVASGDIDPEDWHSSAPFNPVRLRALTIFGRSALFRALRRDKAAPEGFDSGGKNLMEAAIRELMNCFEPSPAIDRGEITDVIREFIFLGSYVVIHANGVDETMGSQAPGVQALASILDPDTMQRGLGKVEGADQDSLWTAIGEAARELKHNLPPVTRLGIVKDLAVTTFYAAGSVTRKERDVLADLAQTLELRPEFVDQVLHSVVKGLD